MPEQDTAKVTRQLGPGKGGAGHFIAVRLNSMALMALYAWLLTALVLLIPDLSYRSVSDWLRHPLNTLMMILLVVITFWHTKYGVQELIDDYVHAPLTRGVAIGAMYTIITVGALYAMWSVVRVALAPA